jgi:hypothetical protein
MEAVKIVAVLCHLVAAGVNACVEQDIVSPTDQAFAGKMDDPIAMPPLTRMACERSGQQIVADWLNKRPLMQSWSVSSIRCSRLDEPKRRAI